MLVIIVNIGKHLLIFLSLIKDVMNVLHVVVKLKLSKTVDADVG